MSHRRSLVTAVLALALTVPLAGAQHGFLWTASGGMQDLGVPAGWDGSAAMAISKSGMVVGYAVSNSGKGGLAPASWTAQGGWHILSKGLKVRDSIAMAVNDSRQIVGVAYVAGATGTTYHAFLWTPSEGMQDLGTLGGDLSAATGINESGEVVGYSTTAAGLGHAFVWTKAGGMQDLGALPEGTGFSEANAINDNGTIVGSSTPSTGYPVAVFWANGQIHFLDALGSDPESSALGINKFDEIVGADSLPKSAYTNAFSWTREGGIQNLALLAGWPSGTAAGINASGEIVGYDDMPSNGAQQAFVWTSAGGTQGLGTLGGPNSAASAINDSGQVVGYSDVQ